MEEEGGVPGRREVWSGREIGTMALQPEGIEKRTGRVVLVSGREQVTVSLLKEARWVLVIVRLSVGVEEVWRWGVKMSRSIHDFLCSGCSRGCIPVISNVISSIFISSGVLSGGVVELSEVLKLWRLWSTFGYERNSTPT